MNHTPRPSSGRLAVGRARAKVRQPPDRASGRPGTEEALRLAATVGAALRDRRTERGLSLRALAARSATSHDTIYLLEHGKRRPRPSILGALAYALCPDDPRPIRDALVAAAGDSLVPDTPRSLRRRRRAMGRGVLAGRVPLPTEIARRWELHRQADEAYARATRLLGDPVALENAGTLAIVHELLRAARLLRDQAGGAISLRAGGVEIRIGLGAP